MTKRDSIIYETDTAYGHYQVRDLNYEGRQARVLYSGQRQAAQSGIAKDGQSDLLFDYNQRLFELVTGVLPRKLLLIGGGMYTLPTALLEVLPSLKIDVVELDPDLDAIAERFFDLKPDPRLQIFHIDGLAYLEASADKYDMIIIDAFMHTDMPSSFALETAVELYKKHLTAQGLVAVNTISSYYGRGAAVITQQAVVYDKVFENVDIFPASHSISLWLSQNLVLVAQAGKPRSLDQYMRFSALDMGGNPYNVAADLGKS